MDEQAPRVFISYRVADNAATASSLADHLRDDLGSSNVFRDRDSLIGGQPWQQVLDDEIARAHATICLIGPAWAGDVGDRRRIDEPDDPVRREVRIALDHDSGVIPVLVDVDRPPSDLGPDISPLFDRHALRVGADAYADPRSSEYQALLVSVWEVMRRSVPGGVLVFTDVGDEIHLDMLVEQLRRTGIVDARRLSRLAAGVHVVPARRLRRWSRRIPDVIVLADEQPGPELAARLAAVSRHPKLRDVALVGAGVIGALSATVVDDASISLTAHDDVSGLADLGMSTTRRVAGRGAREWAAASGAAKAATGVACAALATAGAIAAWPEGADATVRYGYLDITLTGAAQVAEPSDSIDVDPTALSPDDRLVVVDLAIENLDDTIEWRIETASMFFIRTPNGELWDQVSNTQVEIPPSRTVEARLEFVVPADGTDDSVLLVQQHARNPDLRLRPAILDFDGPASEGLDEHVLTNISPPRLDVTGCDDPDTVDIRLHEVLVGDEAGHLSNGAPVWNDRSFYYFERLAVPLEGRRFVTIVGDAARFTICGDAGGTGIHNPVLTDLDGTIREPVAGSGVRWASWSREPTRWMWTFEVDEDLDEFNFSIPTLGAEFSASIDAG